MFDALLRPRGRLMPRVIRAAPRSPWRRLVVRLGDLLRGR